MTLIDENSLFRLHADHHLRRRSTSRATRTRTTTSGGSRTTSVTTSATSSSTSTRTSTRCRSGSSRRWCASGRTCASSATTTRRSTSGAAAKSRTSSPSPTATTVSARSPSTTTSAPPEGVVELGRSVAERIPAGHRLPKAMVAAGHQSWERGDLLALTFDDPEDGGGVDRRPHRAPPRRRLPGRRRLRAARPVVVGLRRAVPLGREGLRPLVEELRSRGIPFVVKGLNRLFDSPEIQAVVGMFRFVVREIDARTLKALWDAATVDPRRRRLGQGARRCWRRAATSTPASAGPSTTSSGFTSTSSTRSSMREETLPGDADTRRARLLPARQVQPGHLRLRADLLHDRAKAEVRSVRQVARAPGARLLRRR